MSFTSTGVLRSRPDNLDCHDPVGQHGGRTNDPGAADLRIEPRFVRLHLVREGRAEGYRRTATHAGPRIAELRRSTEG
jgi:hypothetical protein